MNFTELSLATIFKALDQNAFIQIKEKQKTFFQTLKKNEKKVYINSLDKGNKKRKV